MAAKIYTGDYGTIFRLTVKDESGVIVDLSTATRKDLLLQKPDNTVISRSMSFITDGSDGIIAYTFADGDIDQDGLWTAQANIELPSGLWHTTTYTFNVYDPLIET